MNNNEINNEENEVFTFLVEVEWDLDQPEENEDEDKEYTYEELLDLYNLPTKFEIKSTFGSIADTISDQYGWCLTSVDVIANMDRLVY